MPITKILDEGSILQIHDDDTRGLIVTDLEKGSGIILEKDLNYLYITYPTTKQRQTIDPLLVIDPVNTGVNDLFDKVQDYIDTIPDGGLGFSFLGQNFTNLNSVAPQPIAAGTIAYTFNSEGTAWLPGTIGGSYYPKGIYVSDGTNWVSDRNAIAQQLQINIDDIDQLQADLLQEVQDRTNADINLQNQINLKLNVSDYLNDGFLDYNDTTGSFSVLSDTWTDLPNNGLGAFTNKNYPPSGVTELIDVSTGYIDPTELSLGDTILIRNDYSINPNTNNAQLRFRYELGNGVGSYTLEKIIGRLDSGSGQDYRFSLTPDLIYMGDTNTRDNPIKLQVYCTSNATVTNAGSVIQVVKR